MSLNKSEGSPTLSTVVDILGYFAGDPAQKSSEMTVKTYLVTETSSRAGEVERFGEFHSSGEFFDMHQREKFGVGGVDYLLLRARGGGRLRCNCC